MRIQNRLFTLVSKEPLVIWWEVAFKKATSKNISIDLDIISWSNSFEKLKAASTASKQIFAYAHWLQTHRQTLWTGNDKKVQTGERTQTNQQANGRTDGHYQVHYLPRFAVDNNWISPSYELSQNLITSNKIWPQILVSFSFPIPFPWGLISIYCKLNCHYISTNMVID